MDQSYSFVCLEEIEKYSKQIDYISSKLSKLTYSASKTTLEYLQYLHRWTYDTIHEKLYYEKTSNAETSTRKIVKFVINKIIPLIQKIITIIAKENKDDFILLTDDYMNVYDDFYAIASYRSLVCFAKYMETQDLESDKIFKYNMNVMKSVFYYSNEMILNKSKHNMVKRCPTGYGKSKSDNYIISYIFGVDMNADVLKVVGNKTLITPSIERIVGIMCSKKYGKVFPQIGKYNGDESKVFKKKKIGENSGTFILNGSQKGVSLFIVNKDTNINGGRFAYHFYDDITQMKDAENINAHIKDVNRYYGEWKKRVYDDYNYAMWFTGTSYHQEDFLSVTTRALEKNKPNTDSKFPYCKITNDEDAVIIRIPKIDENGNSTCPQKYSIEKALEMKEQNERLFYAMEQQDPLPPEKLPFDYRNLKTYTQLPEDIMNNNCKCIALIDLARKAKNYISMPILKYSNSERIWYLVDAFYRKVSNVSSISLIYQKLNHHCVDECRNENNTDSSYCNDLKKYCADNGFTTCTFSDFYTTQNKEDKISEERDAIVQNIKYPAKELYSPMSEVGLFMYNFTNYSFDFKVEYDDAPDSLAMICKQFISRKSNNSFYILDRKKFYS